MVPASPPDLTWREAGPWQDSQPSSGPFALVPLAINVAWVQS